LYIFLFPSNNLFPIRAVFYILLEFFLIYAVNLQSFSIAAELEYKSLCEIKLNGEITLNEDNNFRSIVNSDGKRDRCNLYIVSLNSPGGSLMGALKLIQTARKEHWNLGFIVEDKNYCYSACAIIFTTGQTMGMSGPMPFRYIEPQAKLGFHSPFIIEGQIVGSNAKAFEAGIYAAQLLSELGTANLNRSEEPIINSDLLNLIFSTPNNQIYNIGTIGDNLIYNVPVNIKNHKIKRKISEYVSYVANTCANLYVIKYRKWLRNQKDIGLLDSYGTKIFSESFKKIRDHIISKYNVIAFESKDIINGIIKVIVDDLWHPGYSSVGTSDLDCVVSMDFNKGEDGLRAYIFLQNEIFGTELAELVFSKEKKLWSPEEIEKYVDYFYNGSEFWYLSYDFDTKIEEVFE
jgi:hypothetical protein